MAPALAREGVARIGFARFSHHHLPAYLNEFVFRFNRRFYPVPAFSSALGLAAHVSAPTYETLYSGEWIHPAA
jgi:hypothetical protein